MKPIEITCPHCHRSFDPKSAMAGTEWRKLHAAIVADESAKLRDVILAEVLEDQRLKEAERNAQLTGLRATIELLQRKASQGSQQTQGDVMEVDVVEALQRAFPLDDVRRTSKGKLAADLRHTIQDPRLGDCGLILWEVKNTSTWSDSWLGKLHDDALRAKASLAVIVSRALPKEIENFGIVDGIWIVNHKLLVPLAFALRAQLIACASLRSQMPAVDRDAIVSFISGPEFAQRVQAIVTAVVEMRGQLEREKQNMNKHWAMREKMLSELAGDVTGLCGELEAITTCKLLADSPLESEQVSQVEVGNPA